MDSSSLELLKRCSEKLQTVYSKQEAQAISFLVIESVYSLSRTEILANKSIRFSPTTNATLEGYVHRLLKQEPVQYVIGSTEFYGYRFHVTPAVLIPRPETEELVQLILEENKTLTSILDIGTGSGCIPIVLKLEQPKATVYSIDVSSDALALAQKNALEHNVDVHFQLGDILNTATVIPETELIVSNPPYVLDSEKLLMHTNVLDFEPHLALFISDNNPLLFYEAITLKAKKNLLPKGKLYFEINEQFGKETVKLLSTHGFENIALFKDLNGKDRIVRGTKAS